MAPQGVAYLGIDEVRSPERVFFGLEPLVDQLCVLELSEELDQD
jgi:hypothetical protein